MVVLIFTFGGREITDDKKAEDLANIILRHGTVVGSDLTKVILITGKTWGDNRKSNTSDIDPKKKAEMVEKKLLERGIKEVEIKQVNQDDFNDCLKVINSLCRTYKNKKEEVILNVSGGTREISFGAINAAWVLGLEAFHLKYKRNESIIEKLPIPTIKYITKMSQKSKEYLVVLLLGKGKAMTSNSIQDVRGIVGSTWADAKHDLLNENLIKKRDYRMTRTKQVKLFNWDKVPGTDEGKLINNLNTFFSISWINADKIKKIEGGKVINVSSEKGVLLLSINDEKNKVDLILDNIRLQRFDLKMENGEPFVYHSKKDSRIRKIYELTPDIGEIYADIAKTELESTERGKTKLKEMEDKIKTIQTIKI